MDPNSFDRLRNAMENLRNLKEKETQWRKNKGKKKEKKPKILTINLNNSFKWFKNGLKASSFFNAKKNAIF